MAAAQKLGASEFRAGDLVVTFHPAKDTVSQVAIPPTLAKDALLEQELALKEDRLAMMLIEDPAEYERMMLSGELEDAHA